MASLSATRTRSTSCASPDGLSNLLYAGFKDTTSLWTRLASWLRFDAKDARTSGINVADDLAFALAVCEVVEVAGNVLVGVSYAMSTQAPTVGLPLKRQLAFELTSSKHRGRSHSAYLILDLVHSAQRTASKRTSATLKVDMKLYIYEPLFLSGLQGVAVNVSGTLTDDLPSTDIENDELMRVLATKGTFVASAVSDFVLDAHLKVTSERAAAVTLHSCRRLVHSANAALTTFFRDEYEMQETARTQTREQNRLALIEAARELELERIEAQEKQEAKVAQERERMLAAQYGGYRDVY